VLFRSIHRNRPLHELAPQALAVLLTAARRAGVDVPAAIELLRPNEPATTVEADDRPPLVDVPSYRTRLERRS
jgi:hypothetical protein